MAASVFDSPLHAQLFPTGDTGRLFSDSATLRAMLLVEGALAKVQGKAGLIPETSAAAIHRASLEIQIDPGPLARSTGENGACVPGLVDAFRTEMNAPEHAQYVHWGAASQDIVDTALMLRLRQSLLLAEADLRAVLTRLGGQARRYAHTPMPARICGQHATPTTWGAVLAQWGMPLLDSLCALPNLRARSLWVSLSGAGGTASALGENAPALRKALAEALDLNDPGRSWHTDRSAVMRHTDWMAEIVSPLGSMGATTLALAATGIEEITLAVTGSPSTMPNRQNPVAASTLVALSEQVAALRTGLGSAGTQGRQSDGAVWFNEWMLVPQIVLCTASALHLSRALLDTMHPDPIRMRAAFDGGLGLAQAEALSFALCDLMRRPDAQAATKALCAQVVTEGTPLAVLARATYPHLPGTVFSPQAQTGQSPKDALDFANRVGAL